MKWWICSVGFFFIDVFIAFGQVAEAISTALVLLEANCVDILEFCDQIRARFK